MQLRHFRHCQRGRPMRASVPPPGKPEHGLPHFAGTGLPPRSPVNPDSEGYANGSIFLFEYPRTGGSTP